MANTYARGTSVSASQSRNEIEKTLSRYGASSFGFAQDHDRAMIAFTAHQRSIRMIFPLPSRDAFTRTPTGRTRTAKATTDAHDQAIREQWRAIALVIKAKLQAVESGIVSFEQEFAMFTVLPDGSTVGDHVLPAIDTAYTSGQIAPLIPRRAIEGGT